MTDYASVRSDWWDLLHWHLKINGTRPSGNPQTMGDAWEDDEFARKCNVGDPDDPRAGARTIQNWWNKSNGIVTPNIKAIEKALFGSNTAYDDWRRHLRSAHATASKRKKTPGSPSTAGGSPLPRSPEDVKQPDLQVVVEAVLTTQRNEEHISKLISALESPYDFDRLEAAEDLRTLAKKAAKMSDAAERIRADPAEEPEQAEFERREAIECAKAFNAITSHSNKLVSALIPAVRDPLLKIRMKAASTLGRIGPTAESSVPSLSKLLEDPVFEARVRAAWALGKIGSPDAVAALIDKYDTYPSQPNAASVGLLQLGPHAMKAVPVMIRSMDRPNAHLRRELAFSLGEMGAGTEAIPALIERLNDSEDSVVQYAARSLWKIGNVPPAALPSLREATQSKDPYTRKNVFRALSRITPMFENVLAVLMNGLDDASLDVRDSTRAELHVLGAAVKVVPTK